MCNFKTEGTRYTKCGHYIQTKWVQKFDCKSKKCAKSEEHPEQCKDCSSCEQYYYPDREEIITAEIYQWCHLCEPWYGEEAQRHKKNKGR